MEKKFIIAASAREHYMAFRFFFFFFQSGMGDGVRGWERLVTCALNRWWCKEGTLLLLCFAATLHYTTFIELMAG